jgi:alanine dehydrogenase
MEFGVPKEVRDLEMSVGLTPVGVLVLVRADHTVYVQRNAAQEAEPGSPTLNRLIRIV